MEPKMPLPNKFKKESYVGVKKDEDGNLDYSEAAIYRGVKNREMSTVEREDKPEKLYRAFAVHPDNLSMDVFKQTLTPQNLDPEDNTKVSDGNEKGVYMSTNEDMVDDFYSNVRGWVNPYIEVLPHSTDIGFRDRIQLPNCGIVLEIKTKDLKIRKPKIAQYLKTEYNNGMKGDEWIADNIGPEHYHVKKLILSRFAHDKNRFVVEVENETPQAIQNAINVIKEEYQKRKRDAEEFRDFLTTLSDADRKKTNNFIKKEFQKYKINKA